MQAGRKKHLKRRMLRYLIPILIGMAGLLLAIWAPFESPMLRFTVVLLSVAVPLFAGGNMLAGSRGIEKVVMLGGVLLLLLGAAANFSYAPMNPDDLQPSPLNVLTISRWLGMASLMLGLFVVLLSMVRTGEAIDQIGERFRQLADHISEGFVLSHPDGTIVTVNQRFIDMFDIIEDEVIGENVRDVIARNEMGFMGPHLDLRAKGLASEYEVNWASNGEERQLWISGTPIFDRHGRHMGTLATIRDITEKNRMSMRLEQYAKGLQDLVEEQTQKLRRSEEQLRDLLLHMNEGFLTIDSAYRIQFVNNRICELLHMSHESLRGREVFDFIDPSGRVKLLEQLRTERMGLHTDARPEVIFTGANGRSLHAVVAVSPVKAQHAAPGRARAAQGRTSSEDDTRYSLVITDVSELKNMQHQLELRAIELEAVNDELRMYGRAKDSFLSNVSHELKTPLSTINGYVEMLESGSLGQLQVPQANALMVMGRNVKRLVSLINEMIEFSRMEIRGVQLKMALFSLDRLLREAVASVQPQTLTKDISVSTFVPEELPPVWGDRGKIAQVLGIFLSNAVKFSHQGGVIQLQVVQRPDCGLAISISDTGIGIDASNHARVFEKFFQVDGSMSRRFEGAGIGLSIAKSIVQAHGGQIELDSALGQGCKFTVVLLRTVFSGEVSEESTRDLDRLRALVVADDPTFRSVVRAVLGGCGCEVVEAVNGYECVRLAGESTPDVILFDEIMADAAGATAVSNLHQNLETSAIPIVVFTDEEAARLANFSELAHELIVMTKPFTAQGLINTVRKVCFDESAPAPEVPEDQAKPLPRVLVVDSDPDLLDWVETGLRRRNIDCYTASEATQALHLVRQNPPDVIFADADSSGTAERFFEDLRQCPAPVYVLTDVGQPFEQAEGTAGCLKKPFGIDEMANIVKGIVETSLSPPTA